MDTQKCLGAVLVISTQNIGFHGEIRKSVLSGDPYFDKKKRKKKNNKTLMLSMLEKYFSRKHFEIVFQKIGLDISCQLSPEII